MNAYDAAVKYATDLGAEHGANAAEWWLQDTVGGRARGGTDWRSSAEANARTILRGIDDGDPAVLDTLPASDLSGQWADSLTGPELTADALTAAGLVHDGDTYARPYGHAPGACPACDAWDAPGDIADAYESAFTMAAEAAIVTACKAVLA